MLVTSSLRKQIALPDRDRNVIHDESVRSRVAPSSESSVSSFIMEKNVALSHDFEPALTWYWLLPETRLKMKLGQIHSTTENRGCPAKNEDVLPFFRMIQDLIEYG